MKKNLISLFSMAALAVFSLASCNEKIGDDPKELEAPAIEGSFENVDISDGLKAELKITAPAGISTFVMTIDSDVLEQELSEAGLNGTLDLVNDGEVISAMATMAPSLLTGDGLKGKTEVVLDITELVSRIGELAKQDADHSFTISVSDANDRKAEKICTFHSVAPAGPSITGGNYDNVEISDDLNVEFKISAPAGISSFVLTVTSKALEATLAEMGLTGTLDLVNDEKVISAMASLAPSLITGNDLKGKTDVIVNITELVKKIKGIATEEETHSFKMVAGDINGKTAEKTCTFYFKPSILTIEWPDNPSFAEIAFTNDNKPGALNISASAGIKSITIDISSDNTQYDNMIQGEFKYSSTIDLINDSDAIKSFIENYGYSFMGPSLNELKYGEDLLGISSLELNLNGFIELSLMEYRGQKVYAGLITVVVSVEDNSGQTRQVSCIFNTRTE